MTWMIGHNSTVDHIPLSRQTYQLFVVLNTVEDSSRSCGDAKMILRFANFCENRKILKKLSCDWCLGQTTKLMAEEQQLVDTIHLYFLHSVMEYMSIPSCTMSRSDQQKIIDLSHWTTFQKWPKWRASVTINQIGTTSCDHELIPENHFPLSVPLKNGVAETSPCWVLPMDKKYMYNYMDTKRNRFRNSCPSAIKALFVPGINHVTIFENLAIFTKICKAQ